MRANRTLPILMSLILATAGALWLLDRFGLGRSPEPVSTGRPLLAWPGEEPDLLLIERDGLRIECRREKGGWFITSPIRARADEAVVNRILDLLEKAAIVDTIMFADLDRRGLSLADLGLDPPAFRIVVGTPARRFEILAGDELPLEDRLYLTLPPTADLHVVETAVFAGIPGSISDFRDDRLIAGDPRRVVQIEIRRPGRPFIQLNRELRQWTMTQPLESRACPDKMFTMLTELFSARVREFAWPSDAPEASTGISPRERLMVYGLDRDENVTRVSLRESGQAIGSQLRIGQEKIPDTGTVYVNWTGEGTIAEMEGDFADLFAFAPSNLRDRVLLRTAPDDVRRLRIEYARESIVLEREEPPARWHLTAPMVDDADSRVMEEMLRRLSAMRADRFVDDGQVVAGYTNRVSRLAVSGPDGRKQLDFWPASAIGDWLVRVDRQPYGYVLPEEAVPECLRRPADALAFRDRTVLAVVAGGISRLTRGTADGRTVTLERSADGEWRADAPLPSVPDAAAIEEILFLLAHLRADKVVALGAGEHAGFGFAEPVAEWTIEHGGRNGETVTLLFGGQTPDGGRYVKVHGSYAVFALDPETSLAFLRPLLLRTDDSAAD